jgi:predicted porin
VTGLFGYETAAFGVNASYDILYGNTGAAAGLTSSNNSDKRVTANAYVKVGEGKLAGGVVDRTTRAATGLTSRTCTSSG